ncbi:hypothetical protein GGU10DRAFT_279127 [Lentinula aff. detonsa]|uniref:GAG-pre-integrase domain-containing protein n=1 Tax=Lentinula aff. detonsa TaxID=2804958 RepID=A0AA38KTI3_9AGAR|nr:hypothetical protein GGU10DRAFT_279127 [Lentinula aff. detonsa]
MHFLTGYGSNGLYHLIETKQPLGLAVKSRSLNKPVDLKGWHRRMGHAGLSRIRMMIQKSLVNGMVLVGLADEKLAECDSCHMGKAKR